jgi:hypothetical protein
MLRMGDARPSISAEAKVHEIIDRALNVQKTLRFLATK